MRGLIFSTFNTTVLNFSKIQCVTSYQRHFCYWVLHKNLVCPVNNNWPLMLLTQHNGLSSTNKYCYNKSENYRQFSTTIVLSKSKDRGKDKKKHQTVHVDFKEMAEVVDVDKLLSKFEKSIESLKEQYLKYTSVRTAAGAIEEIPVRFEGESYTIQQLAEVSRSPKLIVLNVCNFPQTIPGIVESLTKSQMNLNPQQDGTKIYIQIPKVTKELRENLSKQAKAIFIKYRDNIKEIRNKEIKAIKKQEGIPIDLTFRVEGYLDVLCKQYVSKAEQILEAKQKELLGDSK